MTKKIIIGNWKMNPTNLLEAKEIYQGIKKTLAKIKKTQVVICPPFVYLTELKKIGLSSGLKLGAQDVFWEEAGAHTGEISPLMLKNIGATHVIIGHSERRALGENAEILKAKVRLALKNGFQIIFCIGEKDRDAQGHYLSVLQRQLTEVFDKMPSKYSDQLIIAYEPVWAIGKNASGVETPEGFNHNAIFVRKILSKIVGKKRALEIPILYGGSVSAKNADDFLRLGGADGLLVGRDSLTAKNFSEILKIAETGKK